MDIDFMIACPDVQAAERIAPIVSKKGYTVQICVDKDPPSVTCYCMKHMLLEYHALIASQNELDEIAKPHGSFIDGWGTFGNVPDGSS